MCLRNKYFLIVLYLVKISIVHGQDSLNLDSILKDIKFEVTPTQSSELFIDDCGAQNAKFDLHELLKHIAKTAITRKRDSAFKNVNLEFIIEINGKVSDLKFKNSYISKRQKRKTILAIKSFDFEPAVCTTSGKKFRQRVYLKIPFESISSKSE